MSDSNCVICLELLSHPVAAVNPCGHCFHEQCFRDWDESKQRHGETTRCPMCNKHALSLQRIFIHLPYDNEDNEDDSGSLSSCDTAEDMDNDGKENSGKQKDGLAKSDEPKNKSADHDVAVFGNETGTRDASAASFKTEVLIDLSSSPSVKERRNKTQDNDADDDAKKLKGKAKRLKKRVKMLESQRREFVDKERTLTQQHSEAKERLIAIEAEFKVLKAIVHEDKLELEHRRLEVVQIRAERDAARASYQSASKQVKSLDAELNRLRQNFQRNLSHAQAQGMAEAQLLKEQHQQLGDDNNKLKQAVLLKDTQIHDLNRQLQRMQSLVQGKVDQSMKDLASNSRKRAAMVGKSFLEAEHMLSAQRDEEERRRSLMRDERTEVQQRMKSKISHQAARFSAAIGKKNALLERSLNVKEAHHDDYNTDEDGDDAAQAWRAREQGVLTRNLHTGKGSTSKVSLNLACSSKRGRDPAGVVAASRNLYSLPPPTMASSGDQRPKKRQSSITTMFHKSKG